ncbi:MAG: hypothetical protein H8E89_05975 [Candidatus Nitrosopelagicus sp.]|nr:hypothetical protein [Candidatus Nitrosopelagicus sp.]
MDVSLTGEYEITEAINMMIPDRKIVRNYVCETSIDVGTKEGIQKTISVLQK